MKRGPKPQLTVEGVIDCGKSGWTISETAEEFGVSYATARRFIAMYDLKHLFRHGNVKFVTNTKQQSVDDPPP